MPTIQPHLLACCVALCLVCLIPPAVFGQQARVAPVVAVTTVDVCGAYWPVPLACHTQAGWRAEGCLADLEGDRSYLCLEDGEISTANGYERSQDGRAMLTMPALICDTLVASPDRVSVQAVPYAEEPRILPGEQAAVQRFATRTWRSWRLTSLLKDPAQWRQEELGEVSIQQAQSVDLDGDGKPDRLLGVHISIKGAFLVEGTAMLWAKGGELKRLAMLLDGGGATTHLVAEITVGRDRALLFEDDGFLSAASSAVWLATWHEGRLREINRICCRRNADARLLETCHRSR